MKRTFRAGLALATCVLAAAFLLTSCGGGSESEPQPPPPPAPEPAPQPPPPPSPVPLPPTGTGASWTPIAPGGKTLCARGGPFTFWTRVANPKKLVVFFQGGGACFDEATCAVGSRWFEDTAGPEDNPGHDRGIFELSNPRNPFRDWSWVVIPTCTGDVHIGDRRATYGNVTVEQRGWQNSQAALRWAFERFDPDAVFVAGCSAGSVGSAFHAPSVLAQWPQARVSQLSDSFAFVTPGPVSLEPWGAPQHFPSFYRPGTAGFTMVDYVTELARTYPERTFARFNYSGDNVQKMYLKASGVPRSFFEPLLAQQETALKLEPNYRSYLACGGYHCALPSPRFYTTRVQGVPLSEWVGDLAGGRNVSCPACRG